MASVPAARSGSLSVLVRFVGWLLRPPGAQGSLRELDRHVLRDLGLDRPAVATRTGRR